MSSCRCLGSFPGRGRRARRARSARQRLLQSVRRLRLRPGNRRCTPEQIRADLKAIAPYTRTVRTYTTTRGAEAVPEIAQEFGLRVSLGIWLDKDAERNDREIQSAFALARKHRNIDSIVVGNETIYRNEQLPLPNLRLNEQDAENLLREEAQRISEAQTKTDKDWAKDENNVRRLIRVIQRVKRETGLAVTTGEIHAVWSYHPSLASAVDFIGAHVLPYWEGISGKPCGRPGGAHLQPASPGISRQADGDRRVRLAERRLQPPRGGAGLTQPGGGAAHVRQPRRGDGHRLQHHRSLRPAVEGRHRRRRRRLLGLLRHLARSRSFPGPGRSPIRTTGS